MGFYVSNDPTNSVKALKEHMVLIQLQQPLYICSFPHYNSFHW